jgi:preprotein translocase subunit SecG
LLIGAVLIVPKRKSKGSIDGITTATFFGAAGMAAFMNLSPIVRAFAVGMPLVEFL